MTLYLLSDLLTSQYKIITVGGGKFFVRVNDRRFHDRSLWTPSSAKYGGTIGPENSFSARIHTEGSAGFDSMEPGFSP